MEAISLFFSIVSGVILLLFGRRLFWLFVAAIGFGVGFALAGAIFNDRSGWVPLLIALVVGALGAWLAIGLQKIALAVAGFAAGGFVAAFLVRSAGLDIAGVLVWIAGGILGAIFLNLLFNWALIILSAASGAVLLTRSLPLLKDLELLQFIILLLVGFVFQASLYKKRKRGA